jgi:hypothetical protein
MSQGAEAAVPDADLPTSNSIGDVIRPGTLSSHNIPSSDVTRACCGLTARSLVSRKKLRFVDDGVDLDLSYISDRLIAMGFPSSGLEACYRNPLNEVRSFLDLRHANHYRLWNLCSEREYSALGFPCEIERFTWDDHTPPPFALVSNDSSLLLDRACLLTPLRLNHTLPLMSLFCR